MHGALNSIQCASCLIRIEYTGATSTAQKCTDCGSLGSIRPDIVWFGEEPRFMPHILSALQRCSLFVSIGTSGNVYPAAGFVALAAQSGANTVELNLETTGGSEFGQSRQGLATELVPKFVEQQLEAWAFNAAN